MTAIMLPPSAAPRILDLLPAYSRHLAGDGARRAGVASYTQIVRLFARWLDPEDAQVSDIHRDLVIDYRDGLAERGLAAKTIGLHLSAIRRFCVWCVHLGHLASDPTIGVKWPRLPQPVPRALSSDELAQLHQALATPPEGDAKAIRLFWRNRRIIYIMLYAGLRILEASRLDWSDIDLASSPPRLIVSCGKGGVGRSIPLHSALIAELERVPAADRQGAVCGTKGGAPITEKSLAHIMERWLPARGFRCSAHQLRHSFASLMHSGGADAVSIQRGLGHVNLSTTARYIGPNPARLRAAIELIPHPSIP